MDASPYTYFHNQLDNSLHLRIVGVTPKSNGSTIGLLTANIRARAQVLQANIRHVCHSRRLI